MRFAAAALALIMALAASASSQENEPIAKDSMSPRQAFFMSAADLAAVASKLPNRPSANTTLLERYEPSAITGTG
ncbi:MAG: hypothetical protein HYU37_22645, partial [Acidobacteria bacterium]|nr:hypothetical protein [Acidobacteriota bacterium]